MQMGITAEEVEKQLQEKAALSEKSESGEAKKETNSGEEDTKTETDEENIPFHKHPRFQEMARQNREFKAKLAEIDRSKAEEVKEVKKEFKMDPNMPFDQAMAQIKREAAEEALALFREEQNRSTSKISAAEALINDGFDYLRDTGLKISAKDEEAIANIALEYKINIEQPEDLERAYKIFDMSRKSSGAGKAKEDSTVTKERGKNEKGSTINYSQTSWSSLGGAIGAKLGIKSDNF